MKATPDVHDLELRLRDLFELQQRAVQVRPAPWFGPPVAEKPQRMWGDTRGRYRLALAVTCLLALAGSVYGLVLIAGRDSPISPADGGAQTFRFATSSVRLAANDIRIDAGGRSFAPLADVTVDSDPGNGIAQSLELTWFDQGTEMRLNIYFAADGTDWWVSEMRTYDGSQPGDWITYRFPRDEFLTPLGQAYTGDMELSANARGIAGHLRLADLTLQPFLEGNGPRANLPAPGQPPNAVVPADPVPVPVPVTATASTQSIGDTTVITKP